LLADHYDQLFAVCRRLTGNDADAADATQDALVAIVRGLPRFDARSRFSTWAYRIAVNASLDELRRRRRRPEPSDAVLRMVQPSEPASAIEERLDIDAALRSLAPEFRAAVVLRDLCGLDYAEIAEILDVPPGTVKSRIARGRASLVPLLGNPDPAADRPTTP
jgi:RNA polymerase sigma-70 factor (ECF subfamily)